MCNIIDTNRPKYIIFLIMVYICNNNFCDTKPQHSPNLPQYIDIKVE